MLVIVYFGCKDIVFAQARCVMFDPSSEPLCSLGAKYCSCEYKLISMICYHFRLIFVWTFCGVLVSRFVLAGSFISFLLYLFGVEQFFYLSLPFSFGCFENIVYPGTHPAEKRSRLCRIGPPRFCFRGAGTQNG